LAESKINKTQRSLNKKTLSKSTASESTSLESPTPHPVPVDPSLLSSEQRMAIAREVLLEFSSAQANDCPTVRGEGPDNTIGNHFVWSSSQINTDLAIAAQCEFEEDIYLEDEDFFDLYRSPMYWNLRQTFMQDAEKGYSGSLLNVVWRAYKAGLVSPDRGEKSLAPHRYQLLNRTRSRARLSRARRPEV
jgi:hypothetical protein